MRLSCAFAYLATNRLAGPPRGFSPKRKRIMPMRAQRGWKVALAVAATISAAWLAGCGATPADPVPFKDIAAGRIVKPGYTQPAEGKVAVEIHRERSADVIVRFRDVLVYVDGAQVTDLMNGERVVFYLSPGTHRIGVSTQFDPVVEIPFTVDARFVNRASIGFGRDHRVVLRRLTQ
jgi:hypothetical protein